MWATGVPVSLSFSVSMRQDRGSFLLRLSTLDPYHLQPAMSNFPPRYAGIAMKRRSGPSFGMFGKSGSFGNCTMQPCEFPLSPPIR